MKQKIAIVVMTAAVLSACGHSQTDRTLSGGAIGAGVGGVGSAVLGANPITGAVVGGAVGAATGAVTKDSDINLGTPAWKR